MGGNPLCESAEEEGTLPFLPNGLAVCRPLNFYLAREWSVLLSILRQIDRAASLEEHKDAAGLSRHRHPC